jgi:hypothetical protein
MTSCRAVIGVSAAAALGFVLYVASGVCCPESRDWLIREWGTYSSSCDKDDEEGEPNTQVVQRDGKSVTETQQLLPEDVRESTELELQPRSEPAPEPEAELQPEAVLVDAGRWQVILPCIRRSVLDVSDRAVHQLDRVDGCRASRSASCRHGLTFARPGIKGAAFHIASFSILLIQLRHPDAAP